MNATLQLMRAHHTVRTFLPTPLPPEQIARAVAAAQCAASSSWIQAYALIEVTDRAERERLVELTGGQPQVAAAGAFFAVCADVRRHRLLAEQRGLPYAANLEAFLLASTDATLFAQNLALAFESQGLGTCFVGGLRNRLPEVDALLEIPADVFPLFGLCAGIPDPSVPGNLRPRLPVDLVWMRGRYLDDERLLERVAAFDRQAADYYARRGKPGHDWSGGVVRKFVRPLRSELCEYYEEKGARLR